MNISRLFIQRPVATTLITIGIAIAGLLSFPQLPVSPLPQVDFPTISVSASLPGASPDTVATSVASPLERRLGQIADVTEMTSSSSVGQASVTLQFNLDRDINGAARDVQAAINAARADLPTSLRSNPTYRLINPADAPVLILALTSHTLTQGQVYDAASNILQQRLSQLDGVGQVAIGGSALPAVRVELNPLKLFKYGIGLEDVRAALASANANSPKGAIESSESHIQIYTNDQASKAADYQDLIVAYRNANPVRLIDVGDIVDSVEDIRNEGLADGKQAVLVIIYRQPGANIIDTVEGVRKAMVQLKAAMPADIQVTFASDRSTTIRASLFDTEKTLVIAVLLVIAIVTIFLADLRAAIIPSVAVPVSIIGTFAIMYLLGFSLDIFSLMALTIATGFVVDDAIVVLENIARYVEDGMPRMEAALRGAREVSFTVISISLSLIAVFTPILLMSGILGRLFREFALTLTVAILVSLVVSLTATPMLCSLLLKRKPPPAASRRRSPFSYLLRGYETSLAWSLRHYGVVMAFFVGTLVLTVALYIYIPKGFFPEEDTGRMTGSIQADQSISFQAMSKKLAQLMDIIKRDPGVQTIVGFTGAGSGGSARGLNTGSVFIALKPLNKRDASAAQIIARLRRPLAQIAGAKLYLQAVQDVRMGGRQSPAEYQYTLESDSSAELYEWTPKLVTALSTSKIITDVNSDQQQKGLESDLTIDRDSAARLGITPAQIDNTLYDAFGQRQVSTIYSAANQYHVVMEAEPRFWENPSTLGDVYVSTSGGTASGSETTNAPSGSVALTQVSTGSAPTARSSGSSSAGNSAVSSARNSATNAIGNTGNSSASAGTAVSTSAETMIPLTAVAHYAPGNTPLTINHQGPFVATTISFNLAPGASLGAAADEITTASANLRLPASIHGSLAGTAQLFTQSLSDEPILILAALVAVYIVLGVLYESYIHPLTIISTLPSAGLGALISLMVFKTEFTIIALIGVILLMGIVKKNAIMLVDFAIEATREQGLSPRDAIFQACMLRFRPIIMTTLAAILGALPLAVSFGDGAEIRRPLGIAIVGGLIVSQLLTLYTTPVLYLLLERFSGQKPVSHA
jgi:multidrug efflux pump